MLRLTNRSRQMRLLLETVLHHGLAQLQLRKMLEIFSSHDGDGPAVLKARRSLQTALVITFSSCLDRVREEGGRGERKTVMQAQAQSCHEQVQKKSSFPRKPNNTSVQHFLPCPE